MHLVHTNNNYYYISVIFAIFYVTLFHTARLLFTASSRIIDDLSNDGQNGYDKQCFCG